MCHKPYITKLIPLNTIQSCKINVNAFYYRYLQLASLQFHFKFIVTFSLQFCFVILRVILSACQYSCLFVALLQSTIFFISPLFLTIASVFVSISITPTIQLCLSYSACLLVTTLKNNAHAIIWNNKPGYPVFPTILFWSLIWIICVIYDLNHSCSLIDPFFVCSPTQKLMQPNCWIFILCSKLDCCFISMQLV